MDSDDPITLSAIAASVAITASATQMGMSIYQMTRGTPGPDIPTVEAPAIPKLTVEAPAIPKLTVEAPQITVPTVEPIATAKETGQTTAQALALKQRRGRAASILSGPSGLYTSPRGMNTLLGQ